MVRSRTSSARRRPLSRPCSSEPAGRSPGSSNNSSHVRKRSWRCRRPSTDDWAARSGGGSGPSRRVPRLRPLRARPATPSARAPRPHARPHPGVAGALQGPRGGRDGDGGADPARGKWGSEHHCRQHRPRPGLGSAGTAGGSAVIGGVTLKAAAVVAAVTITGGIAVTGAVELGKIRSETTAASSAGVRVAGGLSRSGAA